LAHRIQMGLLPRDLPRPAGYDVGALIVPMSAIGGDFYDFIPLDHGRLGIAIGDVSGHGVPAALFMALTMTLLRAEACRDSAPRDVLRHVNRQLVILNSEGMFVTVLYGVLDLATGVFDFVRAGHEAPLVCSGSGGVVEAPLQRSQFLGAWDEPVLAAQTLTVPAGGTLLLFTDGVTEAPAPGAEDDLFGKPRLRALLCSAGAVGAQAVCETVLQHVSAHSGGAAPSDDITLVCVRAG
jgi:phosphoserine phosphatase RsbU/P